MLNVLISTGLGIAIFATVTFLPFIIGHVLNKGEDDAGERWFIGIMVMIATSLVLGLAFLVGDTILHAA